MPSDHLFWSAFRAPTFFLSVHLQNLTLRPCIDPETIECVKFTVNLTFQLKVTDSVALK